MTAVLQSLIAGQWLGHEPAQPGGNLVHEGPVLPLSRQGGFAGTHILVPRGGVAVHINDGLDTLRFIKPVGIGDTIQARLTCKRKIDRQRVGPDGVGQGVVTSYDILTLVAKKAARMPSPA